MATKSFWQSMTGWMNKPEEVSSSESKAEPSGTEQDQSTPPTAPSSPGPEPSEINRPGSLSPSPPAATPPAPSGPGMATPGSEGAQAAAGSLDPTPDLGLEINRKIVDVIKTCYDPEIPVNIYELGLIYDVKVDDEENAHVTMTLTAPNCPAAQSLPAEVKTKIEAMDEIKSASVEIVFDPPWNPNKMSDAAKLTLNIL